MNILAIDPGPMESGFVVWNGIVIGDHRIVENKEIQFELRSGGFDYIDLVVIEKVAHYGTGMAVGSEVFDTCYWSGRFIGSWEAGRTDGKLFRWSLIPRHQIKMHLCGSMRAKDTNIRQSLIDRFGDPGTKKEQGLLYGIHSHEWAALALAVTAYDQLSSSDRNPRICCTTPADLSSH